MGLFKSKQERAESKAYRQLVKKKTTLAARQSYAEEAVKVAGERARAKARRPSLFGIAGERIREGVKKSISGERRVVAKARSRTVARASPVTRVRRRTIIKSRAKTRRVAKRYIRRMRRKAPVRKVSIRKAPAQTSPTSLNQAIYGGY